MALTLEKREYQDEAVAAGVSFMLDGSRKNGIIVAPTGCGKSVILSRIAAELGEPLLVFCPSREIVQQNAEKLRHYGFSPSIYSASLNRKQVGSEVVLATIGSAVRAPELFMDYRHIVVDEAHTVNPRQGMYRDFFKMLGGTKILGLTATPYRMASNSLGTELRWLTRTKTRIFHEVVYYIQNSDLFDEGYLAKLEYQIVRVKGFNRNKLKVNSTGADYDEKSVQGHLFEIGFETKLEKVVGRLFAAGRKSVLVFTRFVQEAERLASAMGGAVVTAKTPKAEREAILKDFKRGRVQVVANVNCLAVGFDYPELDTVLLARPTLALNVYYQQCGRGIRPHPDKKSCWIVDMVGLVDQFGKIEDLKIHEDPWCIRSGDRQLTNSYLTDKGKQKCDRCGSSLWFWARHSETNNAQRISRPTNGVLPNIKISRVGGKTLYDIVEPGRGEFLVHAAICPGRVKR